MNFESPYVDMPGRLTVRQNLSVFGRLYGVPDLKEQIGKLAADLDLNEFLDRPSGKLSAGQKTRVALAKALINEPEPVANADANLDSKVTMDEWRAATARRFEQLDKAKTGRLTLDGLRGKAAPQKRLAS